MRNWFFARRVQWYINWTDRRIARTRIEECGESLISLEGIPGLTCICEESLIRESAFEKLRMISASLEEEGLALKVFEAYIKPEEQMTIRESKVCELKNRFPDKSEKRIEHMASIFVAPVDFAPHCTGGAIDLTLYDAHSCEELDMGTPYMHFGVESYTNYPELGKGARQRRGLLKGLMEKQDFFNLPSEWWHFSYGNSEWATYMKKTKAVYGIIHHN